MLRLLLKILFAKVFVFVKNAKARPAQKLVFLISSMGIFRNRSAESDCCWDPGYGQLRPMATNLAILPGESEWPEGDVSLWNFRGLNFPYGLEKLPFEKLPFIKRESVQTSSVTLDGVEL